MADLFVTLARRLRHVMLCGCVGWTMTAVADDTEIYVNPSIIQGLPNVLFIIDTSGSMTGDVSTLPYDPKHDYRAELLNLGNTHACENDRLYYKGVFQSRMPHCGTPFPPFSDSDPMKATIQHIDKDSGVFSCKAAWTAMDMDNPDSSPGTNSDPDSSGFFHDEWTGYDPANTYGSDWMPVDHGRFVGVDYDHIECRTDQGITPGLAVHGPGSPSDGTPPHVSIQSPPYDTTADPNFPWGQDSLSEQVTFYTGNYLNYHDYVVNRNPPGTVKSRIQIVKDILKSLIRSIPPINAGLMATDSNTQGNYGLGVAGDGGGDILFPITPLDTPGSAARRDLIAAFDSLPAAGRTPLAEALYEAYLYWAGETMKFGDTGTLTSVAGSRDTNNSTSYDSPLSMNCSANYQVILTDGAPTSDDEADTHIQNLIRAANNNTGTWLSPRVGASDSCSHSNWYSLPPNPDTCLDDLAEYMNKVDITPSSSREHTVATYAVGFGISAEPNIRNIRQLLDDTTKHGGGEFHEAGSSASAGLASSFQQIISRILKQNTSFTSPAISVNALNRLVHNNELYYALFEPGVSDHWPGNIKRYQIEFVNLDTNHDGITEQDEGEFQVLDVHGNAAVNPNTGQFRDTATSWWRLSGFGADGNEATKGGLAHRLFDWDAGSRTLLPDSRIDKVFTYVQDYPLSSFDPLSPKSLVILNESNAALSVAQQGNPSHPVWRRHFGLPRSYPDSDFEDLIRWIRGVDTEDVDGDGDTSEGRPQMGAPLHTRPSIVTYAVDPNNKTQENWIFSMTNDGYFHASKNNPDSPGSRLEKFAFVPKQLLENMDRLRQNTGSRLVYGLDGGLAIWRKDTDGDGNIESAAPDEDHVYAYFGMRRGGRSVFALDVTDLSDPKLLWVINPDTQCTWYSQHCDQPHLKYLGESWATPQLARIYDGTFQERDVIILSGGYSTRHDSSGLARNPYGNRSGHVIYIIDAETAELLWWASRPDSNDDQRLKFEAGDMKWSIPAHPRVVDINNDGIVDMFFVADTGGQVWRFDIRNQLKSGESKELKHRITGGVIADLQKRNSAHTPTSADNRRFYYTPDVAVVDVSGNPYLAIAVGSGYRARPLSMNTEERFYLIKDYNVKEPPTAGNPPVITYDKLYEDDLLDITNINLADSNTSLSTSPVDQKAQLEKGWILKLDSGEKVLAPSIVVSGNVYFTTYTPPAALNRRNACTPNSGSGATYIVRIDDARPILDLAAPHDQMLELEDRKTHLQQKGIPSQPLVIYAELPSGQTQAVVLVGKEIVKADTKTSIQATGSSFWYEDTP